MVATKARLHFDEGPYVFVTGHRQVKLDKAIRLDVGEVTAVQGHIANLADPERLHARAMGQ